MNFKKVSNYFPFGLKAQTFSTSKDSQIIDIISEVDFANKIITFLNQGNRHFYDVKPVLRPYSDIFELKEYHKGSFLKISGYLKDRYDIDLSAPDRITSLNNDFSDVIVAIQFLHSYHIDLYGLIKEDLAIDFNSLDSKTADVLISLANK